MRASGHLKGSLDLLLLSILQRGPAHGYAVIGALRGQSAGAFDLPEGTVYPALHKLEVERLVTSSWELAGGRRRRVYEITARGERALVAERDAWLAFSSAVRAVLAAPA